MMTNPTESTSQSEIRLENDHNVYILGAGFSRDAGLPLISDFLVRMRDSYEWLLAQARHAEAEAVEKVLRFRLKAASAAYYVTLDLENIEELFSLASASEGDMDSSIRIAIAATIDFFRNTNPPEKCCMFVNGGAGLFIAPEPKKQLLAKYPHWAKPAEPLDTLNPGRTGPFLISRYAFYLARLLGLFLNGSPQGQNTFITFNYDTVLEDALNELKVPFDYAFADSDVIASTACQVEIPKIPVLKLHGSVNWGRPSQSHEVRRSPLKIYANLLQMLAEKAEPSLVPPTWKKIIGGPLEAIWNAAVHRLETATRIIIIGFSIPPTDMHFKYLLAAGLQKNVSLRHIQFVNPDPNDELRPRAEALLRKSYIDLGLISFSKFGLNAFTNFGTPFSVPSEPMFYESDDTVATDPGPSPLQIHDLGRPAENRLSCDLLPAH
jgi:hypothetical protein